MSAMAKDSHIDRELYDLFLTSGIHMDYARRFLAPEQIDEVDLDALRPSQRLPGKLSTG
jgi:hypothetical protein